MPNEASRSVPRLRGAGHADHAVGTTGRRQAAQAPEADTAPNGYRDSYVDALAKRYADIDGLPDLYATALAAFTPADPDAWPYMIIPMRWPDDDSAWPAAGEEDYCEGSVPTCSSYLHYGSSNSQVSHDYSFDLSGWHTVTFERRNFAVTATVDGVLAWTFPGSVTTMPASMKHVVLQQEAHDALPAGTVGSEDIQVDYIRVEVPG